MNKFVFWIIIGIATVLRFWQLGIVPPSPDWDEVALGYNAYSIMETGRDEYGKFFPLILRSFDDYKPALYAYLIIPFIKLFDLNIITVRLPAAIAGVFAVAGTYLLVKELFLNTKRISFFKFELSIAEISAFLLAISPWHLQFSRIAFEAQVGLSLNIFSILFFIKGLKKGLYFVPSVVLAALSIYVYQSEKVYLPILFLVLAFIYWKDLLTASRKWIVGAILIGILFSIPMFWVIISDPNSLMRAKGVSVFSEQTQFLKRNVLKYADDVKGNDLIGITLDNRRVEYVKAVVSGYMAHFNLNWLFINGDIERHHAPNMGLLYLFELPLLLLGIYYLVFGKFHTNAKLTIIAIFLIAPIPASITSGVPHAVRTINFLPTFQIFTALGFLGILGWLRTIPFGKLLTIIYLLFASFNIFYFLNQYFVQQNFYNSESWQYGWKQASEYISSVENKYKKIVITNDRPLDQSYAFLLFYLKYDPAKYLDEGGTKTGGFREEHKFGKYEFRTINFEKETSGNLFIGRPEDFFEGARMLRTVNYLDGKPAILIVEK